MTKVRVPFSTYTNIFRCGLIIVVVLCLQDKECIYRYKPKNNVHIFFRSKCRLSPKSHHPHSSPVHHSTSRVIIVITKVWSGVWSCLAVVFIARKFPQINWVRCTRIRTIYICVAGWVGMWLELQISWLQLGKVSLYTNVYPFSSLSASWSSRYNYYITAHCSCWCSSGS